MALGDVWRSIRGTMRDVFGIGNEEDGFSIKNAAGVGEIRNAADDAYETLRTAHIAAGGTSNDLPTLRDLQARVPNIEFSFAGDTPPSAGTNSGKFGICHTDGASGNTGQVFYDSGTALTLIPTAVVRTLTTSAAVSGTLSLNSDSLYGWEGSTWVRKGVGGSIEGVKSLSFDTASGPVLTPEGTLYWNGDEHNLNIVTGLGPVLQVGEEMYVLVYNSTASAITNGQVLHPNNVTVQSGVAMPTVELGDASNHATAQGTLLMATMGIPAGQIGLSSFFGKVRDVDTSGLAATAQLWLSATTPGAVTTTKPEFPNFAISLGGVLEFAVDGVILFNQTTGVDDVFSSAHDGSMLETFNFLVTSDGTTITGSLSARQDPSRDLTAKFSDGMSTLDTTPAQEIVLTPGTDVNPQENYVYILKSTKVLTVSTSDFPTEEHARVGKMYLQSAATTQAVGALKNHNWNDHVKEEGGNGHLLHMAYAIREKIAATWKAGCEGLATVTPNASAPDNVTVAITAGTVMQMHYQTVPALDSADDGDTIRIVNDSTTPFKSVTDLNGELTDASGDSMSGNVFSLVLWAVANSAGEPCLLMVNLPKTSYSLSPFLPMSSAIDDINNYAVYDIPDKFQGTGFLIARFTFEHDTSDSGTWDLVDTENLRGKIPNATAGGSSGGGGVTEFLTLTDTPSSYAGEGGKVPVVNGAETGLEFADLPSSFGEVPSGIVDGVNTVFTTTQQIADQASSIVTINGYTQKPVVDYSVLDTTITFVEAPAAESELYILAGVTLSGTTPVVKACAIRQTSAGSGWEYIDDAAHTPVGFDTGKIDISETDDYSLILGYTTPIAEIAAILATTDETYAHAGMQIGASIDDDELTLKTFRDCHISVDNSTLAHVENSVFGSTVSVAKNADDTITVSHSDSYASSDSAVVSPGGAADGSVQVPAIVSSAVGSVTYAMYAPLSFRIYHTGSAWTVETNSTAAILVSADSGGFTITHADLNAPGIKNVSAGNGSYIAQIATNSEATTRVVIRDFSGTIVDPSTDTAGITFDVTGSNMVQQSATYGKTEIHRSNVAIKWNDLYGQYANFLIRGL